MIKRELMKFYFSEAILYQKSCRNILKTSFNHKLGTMIHVLVGVAQAFQNPS